MSDTSKYLLLRDDDVNFFTSPRQLTEVYGFLQDNGLPINFSVIPAVRGDARTYSMAFGANSYEPFLPADVAGTPKSFPLQDNRDLTAYLKQLPDADFLLHGFAHQGEDGRYEFDSSEPERLEEKITAGMEIFRQALQYTPQTFVAPQDQYSPCALRLLARYFRIFSMGWIDRGKLPYRYWPAYFRMKLTGRNYCRCGSLLLLEHPGCVFSRFYDTGAMLERLDAGIKAHAVTVIVTHHWEFYGKDGQLDQARWRLFRDKILSLAGKHKFVTFRELVRYH